MSLVKGDFDIHRVTKIVIQDIEETDGGQFRAITITNVGTDGKEYDVEIDLFSENEEALRLAI